MNTIPGIDQKLGTVLNFYTGAQNDKQTLNNMFPVHVSRDWGT